MGKYDVCASIVVYNSPIGEVIDAVTSLQRGEVNVHIQVIDNGYSEQYTDNLERSLGSGVEVIRSGRNGGYGYGHNIALRRAPPSDHYLVLNPDAHFRSGALPALISFLAARRDVGMVVPKVLNPDGTLQPLNKRNPTVLDLVLRRLPLAFLRTVPTVRRRLERYEMLDLGYDKAVPLEFASGSCMLLKRGVMEEVGGFDEQFFLYFEDADLTRRVNQISSCWYCPDAVVTHVWHRDSAKNWKAFGFLLDSAFRYFRKWGMRFW